MLVKAEKIAQDLWAEALTECSRPEDPGEFEERVLRHAVEGEGVGRVESRG